MHVSRIDGRPLEYNSADLWLPDFLVCRTVWGLWAAGVLDRVPQDRPPEGATPAPPREEPAVAAAPAVIDLVAWITSIQQALNG